MDTWLLVAACTIALGAGLASPAAAQNVNTAIVWGAPTGSSPSLTVQGPDTNIGLLLTPKGTGGVGIGTTTPATKLQVAGSIMMGTGTCSAATAGSIEWTGTAFEGCNGTAWGALGGASLSGLTAATATNSIDNAAYGQTWTWNSLTTGNALTLNSSSETTGSLLSLADTDSSGTGSTLSAATVAGKAVYGTSSANGGWGGYFTGSSGAYGSTASGVYASGFNGVEGSTDAWCNGCYGVAGYENDAMSGATGYGVYGGGVGQNYGGYFASSGSGDGVYGISSSGDGGYFTSTSGYALITGTGNVGIGTTTPATTLDVNGPETLRKAYFESVGALGSLSCGSNAITGFTTNLYILTACSSGTTTLNIPAVSGWPSGTMAWNVTFFVTGATSSVFNVSYNSATTSVYWDKNSTGGSGGASYAGFSVPSGHTDVFSCIVMSTGSVYCGVAAQY